MFVIRKNSNGYVLGVENGVKEFVEIAPSLATSENIMTWDTNVEATTSLSAWCNTNGEVVGDYTILNTNV